MIWDDSEYDRADSTWMGGATAGVSVPAPSVHPAAVELNSIKLNAVGKWASVLGLFVLLTRRPASAAGLARER